MALSNGLIQNDNVEAIVDADLAISLQPLAVMMSADLREETVGYYSALITYGKNCSYIVKPTITQ